MQECRRRPIWPDALAVLISLAKLLTMFLAQETINLNQAKNCKYFSSSSSSILRRYRGYLGANMNNVSPYTNLNHTRQHDRNLRPATQPRP
ncbi:hypothetical protein DSUL_20382 [Desulfovibrionales bacterium]